MGLAEDRDVGPSERVDAAEKLRQALDMMRTGLRLKRASLASAHPNAPDSELDAELERWLLSDG